MVRGAMGDVDPDGLNENGGMLRVGGGGGGRVVSSLDEHTTRSHFPLRIVG